MRDSQSIRRVKGPHFNGFGLSAIRVPRHFLLGLLLIFALLAFEAFNFDTTRYALDNLLGDVRFAGIAWATILAIAFCAIDFAGLGRLFTPERGVDEPKEVWYLTGAWLLGATMNAVMTWWAVSTVLLSHELGNEVLSREQLLHIVPVFVAILVWLTRILFIGAVTIAGERLLHGTDYTSRNTIEASPQHKGHTTGKHPAYASAAGKTAANNPSTVELGAAEATSTRRAYRQTTRPDGRPPRPGTVRRNQVPLGTMRASGQNKR